MTSAYENAMSDLQANNNTQQYPIETAYSIAMNCNHCDDLDNTCGECTTKMWKLAEAAEARATQLEIDNDEMQSYINEIRVALHTEKDELTIDAVRRVISERDASIAQAVAAEREACAELAKSMIGATRREIAAAIRARNDAGRE